MPYQMTMREDGILKIVFEGALERNELEQFVGDFTHYLESATPEAPLRTLTTTDQVGQKVSSVVRKAFANLNADPRLGKSATVGLDRYLRVLVGFVLKATGRNNIRFFDSEELAVVWLKS
ncbi:MAG TPA: hypothetical protein PKZ84_05655 [Anaerolineae bacterium]|nr:hypothetical protein [Anaerolineae bacterium]HQI83952.1 hypothetical protein [Anaerolineae bacterium]